MRKLKKALSLTLALALSLSLAVPAFAVNPQWNMSVEGKSDEEAFIGERSFQSRWWEWSEWSEASEENNWESVRTGTRHEESGEFSIEVVCVLKKGETAVITKSGETFSYLDMQAWSDPDGDGVYDQRLIKAYEERIQDDGAGSVTIISHEDVEPADLTGPLTDYGYGGPQYIDLFTLRMDGSINCGDWIGEGETELRLSADMLLEKFGPNTIVWVGSYNEDTGWGIILEDDAAAPSAVTTVEVAASNNQRLNVRSGPGTNYKIAAPALKNGTVLQISEISGQWGKLADGRGWVYLPATRTISKPAAPAETEQPAEPPMGLGGPSENDLMDPTEPTNPAQPEQPAAPAGAGSYTARKGDTWSSICINFYGSNAQRYNLMNANKGVALKEGAVITLPAKLGKDVLIPAPAAGEGEKLYTVVRGDTLGRIAAAEYGKVSEYKAIFERNADRLKNADTIYEGQVIVLPAKK